MLTETDGERKIGKERERGGHKHEKNEQLTKCLIQLIIALFVAHFYLSKKKSRSTLLFYIQKVALVQAIGFVFFFSSIIRKVTLDLIISLYSHFFFLLSDREREKVFCWIFRWSTMSFLMHLYN